jgi:hypothetical protein
MAEKTEPPIQDLEDAPELYVDGYHGATFKGGVVKLNFFSDVFDPVREETRRLAGFRMTASVVTIAQMHKALGDLIETLANQGIVIRVEDDKGTPDQQP